MRFKAQVTQTCGGRLRLGEERRRRGLRLALQGEAARCSSSLAIFVFVGARSLRRCVWNVQGLKHC